MQGFYGSNDRMLVLLGALLVISFRGDDFCGLGRHPVLHILLLLHYNLLLLVYLEELVIHQAENDLIVIDGFHHIFHSFDPRLLLP